MKLGFTAALVFTLLLTLSGCNRSQDDIRRIAEESAAIALASIPTVTPAPTATPQPTPSPITIPFTPTPFVLPQVPTPLPTPTPITFPPTPTPIVLPPTPTPFPTPTPPSAIITIGQQVSGSVVSQVTGDVTLEVDPENPLAGRDISFTSNPPKDVLGDSP